jgi:hypothetical protein
VREADVIGLVGEARGHVEGADEFVHRAAI